VDVTEPRFLHPDDMLAEVTDAAGLPYDAPPPVVVRCIVESLAVSTVRVIDEMGGTPGIHVFGGGGSSLYRSRLAARAGVPVEAGPVEATALGNALVQGIALGLYPDLAAARATLRYLDHADRHADETAVTDHADAADQAAAVRHADADAHHADDAGADHAGQEPRP
jgi:rhamnulokinase